LEALKDTLLSLGAKEVHVFTCDLSLPSEALQAAIEEGVGCRTLQGVFLNAGLGNHGSHEHLPQSEAMRLFQLNAGATFSLIDSMYRRMVQQNG
ncbi:short-chain dehydrogenase/reductase SDR, partial [Kipferlia bialata]